MAYFSGEFREYPLSVVSSTNHIVAADIKLQLNIPSTDTDHDSFIATLIKPAEKYAENYINGYISTTSLKYQAFNYSGQTIRINATPFISITSIKTGIAGETLAEIAATDYHVEKHNTYFIIHFVNSLNVEEIEIIFSTGYATNKIPDDIKQACIIIAADLFDINRSNYSYTVSNNRIVEKLLNPYIMIRA